MIRHIDFNDIIDVDNLQNELESPNFPWFFQNDTTNYGSDSSRLSKNTIQHPQLCHTFYNHHGNSEFSHLIMPILSNLDVGVAKKLSRVKSNLNHNITNYNKTKHQNIHTDYFNVDGAPLKHNYMSLLYYVNDSDGETKFFNKDEVIYSSNPKKGTALLFNSNIEHAGSNPINSTHRMVVNFVFRNVFDIEESLLDYQILTENIIYGDNSFYEHDRNVFDILKSLNLNDDVCLAGLYHSTYGTEVFKSNSNKIQNYVANKIGSYAESLVTDFCSIENRDNTVLEGSNKDLQYITYANLISRLQLNETNENLKTLIKKYELRLGILV